MVFIENVLLTYNLYILYYFYFKCKSLSFMQTWQSKLSLDHFYVVQVIFPFMYVIDDF